MKSGSTNINFNNYENKTQNDIPTEIFNYVDKKNISDGDICYHKPRIVKSVTIPINTKYDLKTNIKYSPIIQSILNRLYAEQYPSTTNPNITFVTYNLCTDFYIPNFLMPSLSSNPPHDICNC